MSYAHLCLRIFVVRYFECVKTVYTVIGYHGLKLNEDFSQLGDRFSHKLWLINEVD